MNSRLAVGLAVGAGYLLGRTKKAKLAFAVGTVVLGRQLELSPQGMARLVTSQLQQNPQFKEIGDQLREDIRGVGHAATGALVNRQLSGLADRLHDRTLNVRDRTAGPVPHGEDRNEADRGEDQEDADTSGEAADERPRKRTASAPRRTASAAKKAAPKKNAAKKTTTAKKTTAAKKTSPAAGKRAPRKATGTRGGRSRD
ncbi:DNA primase [Streptomyces xantholiticus]|uniref:DNA primase n=1 Tax=Streptomyces xantholiticus TaxID=68285 RepID=A0ABV1UXB3_9ACTN